MTVSKVLLGLAYVLMVVACFQGPGAVEMAGGGPVASSFLVTMLSTVP